MGRSINRVGTDSSPPPSNYLSKQEEIGASICLFVYVCVLFKNYRISMLWVVCDVVFTGVTGSSTAIVCPYLLAIPQLHAGTSYFCCVCSFVKVSVALCRLMV